MIHLIKLIYITVENDYFERREFSFCLSGDIYVRYQSFADCNELEKAILAKVPEKIDIGPVYNIKPKESKNLILEVFKAEERELVFDIDMTDYDEVRTCCTGADICPNCWPFMIIAAKILNRALREDFGFKHLLWVYSGRRGIHCWVADKRARKLVNESRSSIAEYLTVIEGGELKAKKVFLDGQYGIHPSIKLALDIIDKHFDSLMLDKQKILESSQQITAITELCADPELKQMLRKELLDQKFKTCAQKWEQIEKLSEDYFRNINIRQTKAKNKFFVEEVKLQLCYPRLDINVTKGVNHLLKTPFSVHPKTGRICVPIDFNQIDSFDPFQVPNVSALCKQMDDKIDSQSMTTNVSEKTDLKESIKIFKSFILNIGKGFQRNFN